MAQLIKNNASSTLDSNITDVATSITLAAGGGANFPAITGTDYFLVTLFTYSNGLEVNHEILKVTGRTGDVLTVVRAQEGTTARAFNSGTAVQLRLTAGTFALKVSKTSDTGSARLPVGTIAQRDSSPSQGDVRGNTELGTLEWFNGTIWEPVGSGVTGAKGGGRDKVFHENSGFVTENYTIGEDEYVAGVTVTVATPAVFTLANHGFVKDMPVHLRTTGALPTGLAVDTVYYVIATGLTADTFQLSATVGGTAIATSGTQSGVHSVGQIIHAVVAHGFSVADGKGVTVENGSSISIAG